MNISSLIDPKLIAFLCVDSRDEALNKLVELLDTEGKLKNKDAYLHALIEREGIISTGIGMGIALPHAKIANYTEFFMAIGLIEKGVDWKALDGAPVRIVFMIGGPDDKQTEYLQILSTLTQIMKDEEKRKKMLTLKSEKDIVALFTGLNAGK